MANKDIILVIDGLNTFYRSYAVDPSLSTKGEHIGGMKGFLKQLQKFCRENNPKEVLIVWDGDGGSKRRRSIKSDYKDGRKAVKSGKYNRYVDDQLSEEEEKENKYWQLSRLIEYLNKMPVKQFIKDNIEADDIISYICQHDHYNDSYKLIISNDKDFMQLLNDSVLLYRPATKKVYNRNTIIEELGIHPDNMTLARAIAGDSSDNLPGVKGAGLKTLVKRFPEISGSSLVTIDMVLEKAKESEKQLKLFEGIIDNEDLIRTNYKMMQLYSPYISATVAHTIDEFIKDYDLYCDWHEINMMMVADGFTDYSWGELKAHTNKLQKQFKDKINE